MPQDRQAPETRPGSTVMARPAVDSGSCECRIRAACSCRTTCPPTSAGTAAGRRRSPAAFDLQRVAPFFIDQAAGEATGPLPVDGLTQMTFRNAHFGYAVTWCTLAAMTLGMFAHFPAFELARRRGDAADRLYSPRIRLYQRAHRSMKMLANIAFITTRIRWRDWIKEIPCRAVSLTFPRWLRPRL